MNRQGSLGVGGFAVGAGGSVSRQRTQYPVQYPVIKEYTLDYRGLNTMIYGIFLPKP